MVLDSFDTTFNQNIFFYNIIAHEHGHGLGFDHVCPLNETKLMEPFSSDQFQDPQHDDILGGQYA